jgi:Phage integrase family/Restriction endonuclease/Topoisomerase DNA binding C4 zinc finger
VRAETTKNRTDRVVAYSVITSALYAEYLRERRQLSTARGPLFLSGSHRNPAQPLTAWTWSKVVRGLALRAELPQFTTHTLRHLCLTDLARAGWELHAIAQYAGHRNTQTTLQYIHLSGRELSAKLAASVASLRAGRLAVLVDVILEDSKDKMLVQCKHWKTRQIGVHTIRDLHSVVVTERATGGIVATCGTFSDDARALGKTAGIECVDGAALIGLIASTRGDLPSAPTPAADQPPACPKCAEAMVRRHSARGPFWGCSTYPRCRGIVDIPA